MAEIVAQADRAFPTFPRGDMRDAILESFAYALRTQTNPDTGQLFTQAEIQAAISDVTKEYAEAEALDLIVGQVGQQRALWLADQALPTTASDQWLRAYHGALWTEQKLPPSSGAGLISWTAPAGTVFPGSLTKPDPLASKIAVGAVTFQNLYTTITPVSGIAELTVRALTDGIAGNITVAGSVPTVVSKPAAASGSTGITILGDFSGGAPEESSADFARRIMDKIAYRQGSGNQAEMRAWSRAASSAVEDAFIYACALHAGSVLVAVTAKRGTSRSPTARIPSAALLSLVTLAITSPGSPTVPAPPFVLVVPTVSAPVDVALRLRLVKRSTSGWEDLVPFPNPTAAVAQITTVTSQSEIRVDIGDSDDPPATPAVMVWDVSTMAFERLTVLSTDHIGGSIWRLVLASPPTMTLAVGQAVSPSTARMVAVANAARSGFDSLGPGEICDLSTSPVAFSAERFPLSEETWPSDAIGEILIFMREAFGGAVTSSSVSFASLTEPPLPASPNAGVALLTCRHFGIYPL